jgi:hypothetical protein
MTFRAAQDNRATRLPDSVRTDREPVNDQTKPRPDDVPRDLNHRLISKRGMHTESSQRVLRAHPELAGR